MTTDTTKANKPLKDPKREAFAQALAGGFTSQAACFRQVFAAAKRWTDKTVWEKASRLAAEADVKARVAVLQQAGAERAVFTLADHLRRLDELSRAAEKQGEFAAAVRAEENRGKASGFYPTKVELTGKGGGPIETKQTRDLTPDELKAELARYGIQP